MNRRNFVALLGGASAWPHSLFAQGSSKSLRIGVLAVARTSPTTEPGWRAFLEELGSHGFHAGRNLAVETRWVDEDPRGPLAVAAELVSMNIAVLVVEGPEAFLKAAIAAGPGTPIVMSVGNYDPLALGYIKGLARPGGNVTGCSCGGPSLLRSRWTCWPLRSRCGDGSQFFGMRTRAISSARRSEPRGGSDLRVESRRGAVA